MVSRLDEAFGDGNGVADGCWEGPKQYGTT